MTTRDDLTSLFAYLRWADEATTAAVRALTADDYAREVVPGWPSVRSTLVHAFDAATIWARRLDGEAVTSRRTEAEVPALADAERLMRQGHDAFDRLVAAATPDRLAADWSYTNLRGEAVTLPLWAVYRHVVNHATYHRGQVASKLARLGAEPPAADLVVWAAAAGRAKA